MAESLTRLADIGEAFQGHYRAAIENALRSLPTAVCTIYERRYEDAVQRRLGAWSRSLEGGESSTPVQGAQRQQAELSTTLRVPVVGLTELVLIRCFARSLPKYVESI